MRIKRGLTYGAALFAVAGMGLACALVLAHESQASGDHPVTVGGVTFPPDAPGSLTQAVLPTTADDQDPAPPTGLVDVAMTYRANQAILQNGGWQGIIANNLVVVSAGAFRANPNQGVLLVTTFSTLAEPAGGDPETNGLDAPTDEYPQGTGGALSVVSAKDHVLTIQSPSSFYYFDVESRQWLPPPIF